MILLFDLDSTLTDIEGFDEIARQKGIHKPIAEITRRTMDGEIPFTEAFASKLQTLSPTKDEIRWLVELYKDHFVEGAIETINKFSKYPNFKIGILSNNLETAVKPIGRFLGLDMELCIGTKSFFDEFDNYLMLDTDDPLTRTGGKGVVIESLKQKNNDKIIFIGDSVGDMIAGDYTDLFIGYGGVTIRPKVKDHAKYFAKTFSEVENIIINFTKT